MTKKWDDHRDIILSLYREQNKPLHEVRDIMIKEYGFTASIRAYRSRFDKWEIHKYSCRKRSVDSEDQLPTADVELAPSRGNPTLGADVDMAEGGSAIATPPTSPGASSQQPRASFPLWPGFEAQRSHQGYSTPPLSANDVVGSGMETERRRSTGVVRSPSISQPYQSSCGSPSDDAASGIHGLDFRPQPPGGDYFHSYDQFRAPQSPQYQQPGHHLQSGMYGSAPVASLPHMLSNSVSNAHFGNTNLNRCF